MSDRMSEDLAELTEAICRRTGEDGSMPGYGTHFENEVFAMRRFYWGECTCGFEQLESDWLDQNPHAQDCYYLEAQGVGYQLSRDARDARLRALCKKHGIPWNGGFGCMVHCTCGSTAKFEEWSKTHGHAPTCEPELPNFHFKPTGLEVRWYKYIGRGMELSRKVPRAEWNQIMDACLASVAA